MAAPLNILLVEDHDALREVTREVLGAEGHRVLALNCAEDVAELPAGWQADIAVLDLNLPGEDGLSLARRLRQIQPGIGIVMFTVRQRLDDRLAGYDHGADIYLTKPTDAKELCATVAALGRRLQKTGTGSEDCRLDLSGQTLHTPQGLLALRPAELALLQALALAPEHSLESWQLLERLGKPCDAQGKAQLEVTISRLRSRLEAHGAPNAIRAERGKGYRLCLKIVLC